MHPHLFNSCVSWHVGSAREPDKKRNLVMRSRCETDSGRSESCNSNSSVAWASHHKCGGRRTGNDWALQQFAEQCGNMPSSRC
mmetsp:Transcript_38711/g.83756  ORF Transcript_38711/g.83756 Transcript_38711/m.83756 type:complete len:83 (-) Transcript_38711:265-513(-)